MVQCFYSYYVIMIYDIRFFSGRDRAKHVNRAKAIQLKKCFPDAKDHCIR